MTKLPPHLEGVLGFLGNRRGVTLRDVADDQNIQETSAWAYINSLRRMGFNIKRKPDHRDKQRVIYRYKLMRE